jgi:hypothetical protein
LDRIYVESSIFRFLNFERVNVTELLDLSFLVHHDLFADPILLHPIFDLREDDKVMLMTFFVRQHKDVEIILTHDTNSLRTEW